PQRGHAGAAACAGRARGARGDGRCVAAAALPAGASPVRQWGAAYCNRTRRGRVVAFYPGCACGLTDAEQTPVGEEAGLDSAGEAGCVVCFLILILGGRNL